MNESRIIKNRTNNYTHNKSVKYEPNNWTLLPFESPLKTAESRISAAARFAACDDDLFEFVNGDYKG